MGNFMAKNIKKFLFLSLFVVAAWIGISALMANQIQASATNSTIYRFLDLRNGTHFYTASEAERDNVNARWGYIYRYEGVAWNRTSTPIPIYRFYSATNGEHFYTASSAERDNINNLSLIHI